MAELTFTCPLCNQPMTCDEAWCGHEIECPSCHGKLTLPAQEAPSIATAAERNNPLVPKPSQAGGRLALNRHAQQPAPKENRNVPIRNLAGPAPKKASPLPKLIGALVTVIVLGAGGYFGYNWYQQREAAKKAEAEAEAKRAAQAAKAQERAAASQQAAAIPVTWTLDVGAAKIPEAPLSGSIGGGQFTPETVRVDPVGAAQVLRLTQGALTAPDRELLFYFHLKPGEKLEGQNLSVSKDVKSAEISQVVKRWKANPQTALQSKSYASGYVLKLELGQSANGELPGKIYVALPDPEQTVVAGTLKAAFGNATAATAAPVQAAPARRPVPRAGTVSPTDRYGISQ